MSGVYSWLVFVVFREPDSVDVLNECKNRDFREIIRSEKVGFGWLIEFDLEKFKLEQNGVLKWLDCESTFTR